MPQPTLIPLDRPDVAPRPISARLRGQLVYFSTPAGTPGVPPLGEAEFYFRADDVERWLADGVLTLVSPLDTAHMTEVELSDEQEAMLEWLKDNGVQHARATG